MRTNWGRITFWGLGLMAIISLAFLSGMWFGQAGATDLTVMPSNVDFAPVWRVWNILDNKFVNLHQATSTSETKVWGLINGLVDSLGDPYTVFLPPEDKQSFDDEIKGSFGGVGMEIGVKDGALVVISSLEGTPAKRAGILPGDHLMAVDGQPVAKLSIHEAVKLIRGPIGSTVTLKLTRGEGTKLIEVTLTRASINVPTLEAKIINNQVFYLALHNFGGTADQLFKQAMIKFAQTKLDKFILDLRGNPGGYLDSAVKTASYFLPAGKIVVIEQRGTSGEETIYRSQITDLNQSKLKLVVLVDGGSASASEIVAGALADNGVATLVGEKTFGKGSVQEVVPITKDTALKVTIAKWLTPKRLSISDNGIVPDFVIVAASTSTSTLSTIKPVDLPLNKALEILR